MSPLRWDVLLLGLLLALPVLALGLRGDLTVEEVTLRLPWCLAAAWAAVAVLKLAVTPRSTARPGQATAHASVDRADPSTSDEHAPAV